MKNRKSFQIIVRIVYILLSITLWNVAFSFINAPSDIELMCGIVMVLILFAIHWETAKWFINVFNKSKLTILKGEMKA